jgi:hypothetical protein
MVSATVRKELYPTPPEEGRGALALKELAELEDRCGVAGDTPSGYE